MPDTYKDLEYTAAQVDEAIATIGVHVANNAIHVNQTEKDTWNAKVDTATLSAALATKQDTLTTAQLAAVNSGITAAKLTADEAALTETVDKGAKNLFPITATTQTVGDVTFTVNADGTITANGTKTNNNWVYLSTGNSLKAGTYVLSDGLPVGTVDCQLLVTTGTSLGTAILKTAANARPDTQTLTQDYSGLYYAIRIASGVVCNNLTFKPMICKKTDWDISQAYQPYAPTNRGLYESKYDIESHNQFVGIGVQLESNADLDSIDTPGTYQITTTTIASSINNLPSECKVAGSFEVKKSNGSAVVQQYFPNWASPGSQVGAYYIRQRTGASNWTAWYKFQGTAVAAASLSMQGSETRGEPEQTDEEQEQEVR